MKKEIYNNDAYYRIAWSPVYKYDKYEALKIVPEMAGIVCLGTMERNAFEFLFVYGCWRDGCRVALRKLMDPLFTKFPDILKGLEEYDLYYKYTIVDTSTADMQDIMYWLIKTYNPEFNNTAAFADSKRFLNIHVKESVRKKDDVVEKFHGK